MQKLKVNDEVIVLAGKDKGKKGKVKMILRKNERVVVNGINMVKKSVRAQQNNPGGITEKEASIHRSNVAVVDPKTSKKTRVKIKDEDGKRVRVTLSGTVLV